MSLLELLNSLGAGEISGIVVGAIGALSAAIVAIIKALGDYHASKGCTKCPVTGRDLSKAIAKHKKKQFKKQLKEQKLEG